MTEDEKGMAKAFQEYRELMKQTKQFNDSRTIDTEYINKEEFITAHNGILTRSYLRLKSDLIK